MTKSWCQVLPFMCATTIHLAGATPVYVDVDKNNFLLDMNDLTKNYKKTKAVLAVHSYSGVCDLLKLKKFVKRTKFILQKIAPNHF